MALLDCKFFSETLGLNTSMNVILPQETEAQIGLSGKIRGGAHPVLYLLHGLSDDYSIWIRRTSIERYVAPLGLAVVMPEVHRSFYTNMADGYRYFDFVADELPRICRSFFKLSEKRDDTFIAGLSMGGYGAMKIGLTYPERFSAVGSFSGVLDVSHYADLARGQNRARAREMERIFGDVEALPNSEHDPIALATRVASSSGPRPRIYQCCGTEDFLYEGNKAFRDHVRALDFDFEYSEESAAHDWGYWDRKVQDFLTFALGSN